MNQYLPIVVTMLVALMMSACDSDSSRRIASPTAGAITTSDGQVGVAISGETLSVTSGGQAPFAWTVTTGALPDGLSLSSTGELSGIPTLAGTYSFTVTVTDNGGRTGMVDGSITIIEAAPQAASVATSSGEVGLAITTETLSVTSGGRPPFSWTVTSGDLPPGLSLASSGTLGGTPSAAGNFTFTVTVTDENGETGSVDGAINVVEASPRITTTNLPNGREDDVYTTTRITADGGTLPLTWTATGLPPGLALSDSFLQGTPTAYQPDAYIVTITATDAIGRTATIELDLTIAIPEFATAVVDADYHGDGIFDDQIINTYSNETGQLLSAEWVGNYRLEFQYNTDGHRVLRERFNTSGALESLERRILNADGSINTLQYDDDADGTIDNNRSFAYTTDGDISLEFFDADNDGSQDRIEQTQYQLPSFIQYQQRDEGIDGSYEWVLEVDYPNTASDREFEIRRSRLISGNYRTDTVHVTWTDNADGTVTRTARGDNNSDMTDDWIEYQTIIRDGLNDSQRRTLLSAVDRDNGADSTIDVRVRRTFNALDQMLTETRDNDGDGIYELSLTRTLNSENNVEDVSWLLDGVLVQQHRVTYDNWHLGREPRFDTDAFTIE